MPTTSTDLISIARAEGAFDARLIALLRGAQTTVDSLRHQVEQMKGMFDDIDGGIADALADADAFESSAASFLSSPTPTLQVVVLSAAEYQRIESSLSRAERLLLQAIDALRS